MGFIDKIRKYALEKGYYPRSDSDSDDERDDDARDDEDDDDEDEYEEEPVRDRTYRRRTPSYSDISRSGYSGPSRYPSSKVVNLHRTVETQVIISYPESIDEAGSICDSLRSDKIVVVNLDNLKHEAAQRIVDFLSGVIYSLEGDIQYVSTKIFIVAPKNVDITGQFKEELKASGLLFDFKSPYR